MPKLFHPNTWEASVDIDLVSAINSHEFINKVNKFGRNADIDIASGVEDIWEGGGDYTGFNATAAEIVTVTSSSTADDAVAVGTGAWTIELFGLDANWLQQSETVILDGTTAVDSVNSYVRLDRAIVRTAGSGGANAGIITIAQKVTTANIFCAVPVGYNQTMIAAYTIPADHTGFLREWYLSLEARNVAFSNAQIKVRPFGEVFQIKEERSIASVAAVDKIYKIPKGPYAGKTDIKLSGDSDVNNLLVQGGFGLLLLKN